MLNDICTNVFIYMAVHKHVQRHGKKFRASGITLHSFSHESWAYFFVGDGTAYFLVHFGICHLLLHANRYFFPITLKQGCTWDEV